MQVLLTLLGSLVGKIFADKVLGYIALKTILVFLFTIIVPIVLNNFLFDVIQIIVNFADSSSSGASLDGSMSFSGFAAWLISSFKVSESLSVLISALVLRLTLSMVPFVRL